MFNLMLNFWQGVLDAIPWPAGAAIQNEVPEDLTNEDSDSLTTETY